MFTSLGDGTHQKILQVHTAKGMIPIEKNNIVADGNGTGFEMDIMFETERLIVRKFRAEDAQQLYENHMDEEVRKWFPNECYADPEEALDAIRFYVDCVDNGHLPFVLGVELKETRELIGDTGISEVEGKPDETEIGYCIGREYRGKGYATELLNAISGFVASHFDIGVIWGRVVHGNEASAKVLEKNGYQFIKEEFGAEDDPYGNGMLVYKKVCLDGTAFV